LLAAGAAGCLGGDDCPKFAHIVGGDFGRDGDMLWWTLQVEQLPPELTFNQSDVPADFLEYRWAVDIDSDRNGAVDLRASISHAAVSGAKPITTPDILAQTNERLFEVMGGLAVEVASISASITDSTFRLETTTAAAAGLAGVSDRGQSTWTTVYRWGAAPEDQCEGTFR